jgi:transposase-like protein
VLAMRLRTMREERLYAGAAALQVQRMGDNFIDKPRRRHSQPVLALAVWLYLSGLSQRRIARLFGVSTPAVLKWIKTFALKNAPKPGPTGEGVAAVERDEMGHFLKKGLQNLDMKGLLSGSRTAH